jgi:hypothetical protein
MKTIIGLFILVAAISGIGLLTQRGAEEGAVRRVIDEVKSAALNGFQFNNPDALDKYFATVQEGAVAAGLIQTQQAYKDFVAQLAGSTVQFHSFDIQAVEVHEAAKLAKVTYRLHFSVVRNGQAIFGGVAIQDLALLKTSRGWRISGGDAPQLESVQGVWPPR